MMENDTDLDGMLFRARPSTPLRGSQLSPAQEELFQEIISAQTVSTDAPDGTASGTAETHRTTAPRRRMPASLAVAVMTVLVFFAGTAFGFWTLRSAPAQAVTPEPLIVNPIEGEAGAMLMDIARTLQAQPDTGGHDVVRFEDWGLSFSPDRPPISMQPKTTEIRSMPDGTTLLETIAGEPVDGEGRPVEDSEAWPAGALVFSHTFAPGEPVGFYSEPSPSSDWDALLKAGILRQQEPYASEYFRAVFELMSQYSLSPETQASLLSFLATLPGVQLDGETTDRLGRSGISFSTQHDEYRHALIINHELGIIGYEHVYIGTERTDLKTSSVIGYRVWY